jgi:hypothetical protein
MIKPKVGKEKTIQEKSFIGPDVAIPEVSTSGCLPADSKNELNSLVTSRRGYGIQIKEHICTNHCTVSSSTNHRTDIKTAHRLCTTPIARFLLSHHGFTTDLSDNSCRVSRVT